HVRELQERGEAQTLLGLRESVVAREDERRERALSVVRVDEIQGDLRRLQRILLTHRGERMIELFRRERRRVLIVRADESLRVGAEAVVHDAVELVSEQELGGISRSPGVLANQRRVGVRGLHRNTELSPPRMTWILGRVEPPAAGAGGKPAFGNPVRRLEEEVLDLLVVVVERWQRVETAEGVVVTRI